MFLSFERHLRRVAPLLAFRGLRDLQLDVPPDSPFLTSAVFAACCERLDMLRLWNSPRVSADGILETIYSKILEGFVVSFQSTAKIEKEYFGA